MKTQIAKIYHCLLCGRVAHVQRDAIPPQCCAKTMIEACEKSVLTDDNTGVAEIAKSRTETEQAQDKQKPR